MKVTYYAPMLLPVGLPRFAVDNTARAERKSARKARKEKARRAK